MAVLPGQEVHGFSKEFARRIIAAVERVENMRVDLRPERRRPVPIEAGSDSEFTDALIVCYGPNSEDPPTDATYWVRPIAFTAADADDPAEFEADSSATVVLATNLEEVGMGTHGLRVGTPVQYYTVTDADGTSHNVFNKMP